MQTSEHLDKIAEALSLFQGVMRAVEQDKTNPFFNSKYSDLSAVWIAIRPHLTKNGLSVIQDASTLEGGVAISTRLLHSSGQWIECGPVHFPATKKDAHGTGSAITYARRYSLCATLGIIGGDEDDDGNANVVAIAKESQMPPKSKIEYPAVDIDGWYAKMDLMFDEGEMRIYVQECSEKMKKNESETVAYLNAMGEDKLRASVERWRQSK